jgi:hypothetical protein
MSLSLKVEFEHVDNLSQCYEDRQGADGERQCPDRYQAKTDNQKIAKSFHGLSLSQFDTRADKKIALADSFAFLKELNARMLTKEFVQTSHEAAPM